MVVHLADEDHGHGGGDGAGHEEFAALHGGEVEVILHKHGHGKHDAVEAHTEDGGVDAAANHGGMTQHAQIHGRMRNRELAPNEEGSAHHRDDGHGRDEGGREPIVLLAFFQQDLEAAEADGEEANAPPVHPAIPADFLRTIGGEEGEADDDGEDAGGDIDEENPAPPKIVREPAAEHRADGGPRNDAEAEDGGSDAALSRGEGFEDDGLRLGEEAAAGESLEDAREDEHAEVRRHPAEDGGHGETNQGKDEVVLFAEADAQPGRERDDDDIGAGVAGGHPPGLGERRAEIAANVGQGHVRDHGVNHFQDRAQRGGERDDVFQQAAFQQAGGHGRKQAGVGPVKSGRGRGGGGTHERVPFLGMRAGAS